MGPEPSRETDSPHPVSVRTPADHRGDTLEREALQAPPTGREQQRDQVIARRRRAQLDWHTARVRLERCAQSLVAARAALGGHEAAKAKIRWTEALHGERKARSAYYHVAQETGAQISRLMDRG